MQPRRNISQPGISLRQDRDFLLDSGLPAEQQERIHIYCLRNQQGMEVHLCNYGATFLGIYVPDREGQLENVILRLPRLADYLRQEAYIGASVGPLANRIRAARCPWKGGELRFEANEGNTCLHSASDGLNRQIWEVLSLDQQKLVLLTRTGQGRGGYPFALELRLTLSLYDDNSLDLLYEARSAQDALVNLTNHCYFNLAAGGDVLDQQLWLGASQIQELDEAQLPTGELSSIQGTPLDFSYLRPVADCLAPAYRSLRGQSASLRRQLLDQLLQSGESRGQGLDYSYVLTGEGLRPAARLEDPRSGRRLDFYTNQPCLQVYSGTHLPLLEGFEGSYGPYSGLCLEAQDYVDAPNHPEWGGALLRAGERYQNHMLYAFSCVD